MKCDLHVHTVHSGMCTVPLLNRICRESYNDPEAVYSTLKGRGMDLVTVTDHDSVDSLENLRRNSDFFLSEEVTSTMPDGTQSAAKFRIFQWPIEQAPAGLRIFACQHKTPETVWIPQLQQHANGAKRLKQALVVSMEPAKDAAHLGRMIDRDVKAEPDGAVAVPSGSDRADFIFLTREQLGRRYPEVSLAGLPESGGAGLVLATSDLGAAEKAFGSAGLRSGGAVCVAPAAANGTLLAFVKA